MRYSLEREDYRGRVQATAIRSGATKKVVIAGGEATDQQLLMWSSTGVSAHKAVAPDLEEFKRWVDHLGAVVASQHRRGR